MNKPFKIRRKPGKPLTLEKIAAKYHLTSSDLAKIRAFVLPVPKAVFGGKKAVSKSTRYTSGPKKAAR